MGTQTLPVRSLDTDTKAPSGKTADASPLTSISWPGMEHLSLYELDNAIFAPNSSTERNHHGGVMLSGVAVNKHRPLMLAEVE